MPTYKFEALNTSGQEVKESVEASNEEEASQKIKAMGYFVTKLTAVQGKTGKKKGKKSGKSRKTFVIGGVKQKMLTIFTRQFSTLQDAGLPVLRSLRILEKQMKPSALKNALIDVVEDVESGMTLSEAFGKHPKCFDRLYVNMVKAGEAGGALEIILQRLAEFKEKAASLKAKIVGAMVYPSVVVMVAVLILTFIMVMIIPKFKKIFDDFQLQLPTATKTLIGVSTWVAQYWFFIPLFPLSFYLLIKLIRLSKAGNYALDRMTLWIPVVGNLVEKTIVARTMRTLGTLITSGVPILEALAIVPRDREQRGVRADVPAHPGEYPRGQYHRRPAAGGAAGGRHGGEHGRGRRGDRRPGHDAVQGRGLLRRGGRQPGQAVDRVVGADDDGVPRGGDRRHRD